MCVSCFTIIPIRLRKTKLRVITNYDRFFIAHINTIKCYKINVVKVVAGLNANWHYFHRSQWPIFILTKKNWKFYDSGFITRQAWNIFVYKQLIPWSYCMFTCIINFHTTVIFIFHFCTKPFCKLEKKISKQQKHVIFQWLR